jgi:hypothetical protein
MMQYGAHLPFHTVLFEDLGEGSIFAVVKALVLVQFACSVVVVAVDLLLALVDHGLRGRGSTRGVLVVA